jgi:hypothetical protein
MYPSGSHLFAVSHDEPTEDDQVVEEECDDNASLGDEDMVYREQESEGESDESEDDDNMGTDGGFDEF